MNLQKYFRIILVFILFSCRSFSNIPTIHHYGIEQGLDDEYIKSISLDNNAVAWIGTTKGIFSFDGYSFLPLKINQPDGTLNIRDNIVDNNNNLWVSIKSLGLFKVKNNIWENIKNPQTNSNLFVYSFYLDKSSNKLWMATDDGIYYVDEKHQQLYSIKVTLKQTFTKISRLDNDHLFISVKGEISKITYSKSCTRKL